jgi:hypothetical protein
MILDATAPIAAAGYDHCVFNLERDSSMQFAGQVPRPRVMNESVDCRCPLCMFVCSLFKRDSILLE